jgi:hypothetical protein
MGLLEDLRLPMMSVPRFVRDRNERTRKGDNEFADVKLWARQSRSQGNKAPARDSDALSYQQEFALTHRTSHVLSHFSTCGSWTVGVFVVHALSGEKEPAAPPPPPGDLRSLGLQRRIPCKRSLSD